MSPDDSAEPRGDPSARPPRPADHDLAQVREQLLVMSSYAVAAVSDAVKAVVERNDDYARKVQEQDAILDRFEMELDEAALGLLLRGLVASDLRFIAMAMKIAHELERVGDEATTIARRALALNREPPLKTPVAIPRLAARALLHLQDTLAAFANRRPDQARSVILGDREVDALYRGLQSELVDYLGAHPESLPLGLHLLFVAKSLERIADHATNIAEEVVFLCEGRDIRHALKPTRGAATDRPPAPSNLTYESQNPGGR